MDPDTVRCAFKILALFDQKHKFSRIPDALTKRTITLITQSTARPPPPSVPQHFDFTDYTIEEFKKDLEYIAEALVTQALRQQPQLTPADVKKIVTEAIKETSPPASDLPAPPTLEEIRSTVQSTVNHALAPDTSHFTSADGVCPGCHSLNKNCARWKASRPAHEQYRYF
jgi:hypothetical protein